ncbi:riboflavin transporter FmnP [Aequitasia blattaphilus]|uniref:ECF transporter S component n=1 Tax=Aequitasia blattaphilus TaxID=2949332 RepID=A0ABT1E6J6_9FIRM|nr:ECF transporter S component [Aequitasia blattaphilus]MCP1101464.1 ECF transporter S component [Aequitasia blattaphilus]MCR8614104.1 ECF transporter S component [Aequitasia blattaphilus]
MKTQTKPKTTATYNTKKIVLIGMLAAIAYVVMVVGRIPVVSFLKYDPKDVIITIGGFIFGPFVSFLISFIVSLVEMFTVSETGFIGFIMNVIATCGFSCVAAAIYKKKRTISGAVIGLVAGSICMTILMLLWNYLITPLYLGYPRDAVAAMLLPVFLPFNLLKAGINGAITLLLYKPIVTGLRKSGLLPKSETQEGTKTQKLSVFFVALLLLVTCVLIILVLNKMI